MIRPWNRRNSQLAFHELDDDHDNARTGRFDDSVSSSSVSSFSDEGADESSSTPILPSSQFTQFLGLTIPILSRSRAQSRAIHTKETAESVMVVVQPDNSWIHVPPPRVISSDCHHPARKTHQNHDSASGNRITPPRSRQQSSSAAVNGEAPLFATTNYDKDEVPYSQETSRSPRRLPQPQRYLQSPRTTSTALNHSSPSSPPFNPGFCSTIVAETPESKVVHLIHNDSLDFLPSPAKPHFSPARIIADTPDSPQHTVHSRHSNPPYIPPVQSTPCQEVHISGSENVVFRVTPETNTTDKLSIQHPFYYHRTNNPGSVENHIIGYRDAPTSINPPKSASLTMPNQGVDDVSSLGGDSIGETPTKIFAYYNEGKTGPPTSETAAPTNATTDETGGRGNRSGSIFCCCCPWLPSWFRRVPHVLRIAILVGISLWLAAACLVALAIVLGKNSRDESTSANGSDWTPEGIYWTLSPTGTPVDQSSLGLVPTTAPLSNAFVKYSSAPTSWPTQRPLPPPVAQTMAPGKPGTMTTLAPSPSPSILVLPMIKQPPTAAPSFYVTTQFPTFEPPMAMMGMRRNRSNKSRPVD